MNKSGIIANNETWAGDVFITGDVEIPVNITVTVNPGAIITFYPLADYIIPRDDGILNDFNIYGFFTPRPDPKKSFIIVKGAFIAQGERNRKVEISGSSSYGGIIVANTAKFIFNNCSISKAYVGVFGVYGSNLEIRDTSIKDNTFGIVSCGVSEINSNIISGNITGIVDKSIRSIVSHNKIDDNAKWGILCSSHNAIIKDNIISGSEVGINAAQCKECVIEGNKIHGNMIGIYSLETDLMKIINNTIENNDNTAILSHLRNGRLEVKENIIEGSKILIEANGVNELEICENVFRKCETGIHFQNQAQAVLAGNRFMNVKAVSVTCSDLTVLTARDNHMTNVFAGINASNETNLVLSGLYIKSIDSSLRCSDACRAVITDSSLGSLSYVSVIAENYSLVEIDNCFIAGNIAITALDVSVVKAVGNRIKTAKTGMESCGESLIEATDNIIKCGNNEGSCGIIAREASRLVINNGRIYSTQEGMVFLDNSEAEVNNIKIKSARTGISVSGASSVTILKTGIKSIDSSLRCSDACRVVITDSTLASLDGMVFLDNSEAEVNNIKIKSARTGIRVSGVSSITILKTGISVCNTGVCVSIAEFGRASITESNFESQLRPAFICEGSSYGKIENSIFKSETAIEAVGMSEIIAAGNSIEIKDIGINLREQSVGVIENNIINGDRQYNSVGVKVEGLSTAKVLKNIISNVKYGIIICDKSDVKYLFNRVDAVNKVAFNNYERDQIQPIKGRMQKYVLSTRHLSGLRQAYKIYYKAALFAIKNILRNITKTGSLYLRRGLTYSDWVPGASDIDLLLVIPEMKDEDELKMLKQIWRKYYLLKVLFPILGEMQIATEGELNNYLKWGDIRALEAPSSWQVLYGEKITGRRLYHYNRNKYLQSVFGEIMNSFRIMSNTCVTPARYPNSVELFTKTFIDIVKNISALYAGQPSVYNNRKEILERFMESLTSEEERGLVAGIMDVWSKNVKCKDELFKRAYIYSFNLIKIAAGNIFKEYVHAVKHQDAIKYNVCKISKNLVRSCDVSRVKKWEDICHEVARILGGNLYGLILQNPGLIYVIIQESMCLNNEIFEKFESVLKCLKNNSISQNTPCIILTESMFHGMINGVHLESPFNYFYLSEKEGPETLLTDSFEKWQYFTARAEYGNTLQVDYDLLFRETIAIISLSYRMFDSARVWASKNRIVKYFSIILNLRLAIDRNIIAEPYIENVIECYEKEYPGDKTQLDHIYKEILASKEDKIPGDDALGCYLFIKNIIKELNKIFTNEAPNESKEREFCIK